MLEVSQSECFLPTLEPTTSSSTSASTNGQSTNQTCQTCKYQPWRSTARWWVRVTLFWDILAWNLVTTHRILFSLMKVTCFVILSLTCKVSFTSHNLLRMREKNKSSLIIFWQTSCQISLKSLSLSALKDSSWSETSLLVLISGSVDSTPIMLPIHCATPQRDGLQSLINSQPSKPMVRDLLQQIRHILTLSRDLSAQFDHLK